MGRFTDLSNKTFGNWTVISRAESNWQGRSRWLCRCKCGELKEVLAQALTLGQSKSCGCLSAIRSMVGMTFGRLTVIRRVEDSKNGAPMWLCKCSCGTEKSVLGGSLNSNKTKSCGCLNKEMARYKRCVFTKEQDIEIAELYLSGKTAQMIADIYHSNKQPVLHSLNRSGIARRQNWGRASGEKNAHWKGGKRMIGRYLHIKMPEHPFARRDGYIHVSRITMEQHIGRYLTREEVVHHIDGNTLNNDITNLELHANNGEHRKEHSLTQPRSKLSGRFIK